MLNYSLLYLEHLSDRDLELIARAAGARPSARELRSELARSPDIVDELLALPELFDAVFTRPDTKIEAGLTPFLTFGVLVNRTARELTTAKYVPEWVGAGRRLPVFDVTTLRDFVDDGTRRFFLIEFLASFTKVFSGTMWVRTARGYRRRRFSELDPVTLAEMVEQLPPEQQPAGYRRLGDVALFLSGVFPDHTARHPLGLVARGRLARSAGMSPYGALSDDDDVGFLESVGISWYNRAVDASAARVGVGPVYLRDVAEQFTPARRFLNYLTDRFLHRFDTGLINPGV